MGHVDNADRVANSYTASCWTWKWTNKFLPHLLILAIVNSYTLLSSCAGMKTSHTDIQLTLIREMLARAGHEPRPSMPVDRQAPASTNIGRLDTCHNKHWPGRNPKQQHVAHSVRAWCEPWYSNVPRVTRHFVWTEVVPKSTTQNTTYKTSFHSSTMQTVRASTTILSKRTQIFTTFLVTYIQHYAIQTLQHF
jgi:hypothetical protein